MLTSAAQAQTPGGREEPREVGLPEVLITPFVGMGSVFSPRVGAAIAFAWTGRLAVEMEVGYRRSNVDAFSMSANLLHTLPRFGRLTPYVTAGIGLAQHGEAFVQQSQIVTVQRTGVTVNAGGGAMMRVTDRWDYRSDLRWSNTLGDGPEHWRIYNGAGLKVR